MDSELRKSFTAAIPFVMARNKESGGFGATRRLPATIQDTYHALRVLNLSGQEGRGGASSAIPLAGEKIGAYLAACLPLLPSTGTSTTFQLLWACRTAGVEFDRRAVETAVFARIQASEFLEEWYYCARILTEILGAHRLARAEEPRLATILGRSWRCVDEAWMHLYLGRVAGRAAPLPEAELVAWLQACQNGDGGFGFFPGTTSFIENCHACLRALASLGSKPLDPHRAALFLRGCQTAAGGFSRSGRAAPFLDATWHGLASLSLVSSLSD